LGTQAHVTKLYGDADLRKCDAIAPESETIFSFARILSDWSGTYNQARVLRMILLGKGGSDEVVHCRSITEAEWRQMYDAPGGPLANNQFVKCKKAIFVATYERTYNTVHTRFSAITKLKGDTLEAFTRRLNQYAKLVPSIYETYGCADDGSITDEVKLTAKVRTESITNTLLKHLTLQFPKLQPHVTYQTQTDFDTAPNQGGWLVRFVASVGDLMDQYTPGQAFLGTLTPLADAHAPPANTYGGGQYKPYEHSESDFQQHFEHPAFFSNTNQVPVRPGGPRGLHPPPGQQPPPGTMFGLPPPPGQQPPPALRPCQFWPKGTCSSGTACRYPHEGQSGAHNHGGDPNQRPAADCRDFQRGVCSRTQCRFTHTGVHPSYGPSRSGPPARPPGPYESPTKMKPCFGFQKGNCTRGDACRYSHQQGVPPNHRDAPKNDKPGKHDKAARKEHRALKTRVDLQETQLAAVMLENQGHRAAAAKEAAAIESRRNLSSIISSLRESTDPAGNKVFFLEGDRLNR
jgi:hypothetical protein